MNLDSTVKQRDFQHAFLMWGMPAAVILGAATGFLLDEKAAGLHWIGHWFLTALKMLIVPLIVSAVISAITRLGDMRSTGVFAGYSLAYYLTTTLIAVSIGLLVSNLWAPGADYTLPNAEGVVIDKQPAGISDIILSFVHPNIVQAAADLKLLPLVVFSVALGLAFLSLDSKGRAGASFFESLESAMMQIVRWVMWLAPIGVYALIASRIGEAGGGDAFMAELTALGKYVLAVISGLLLHSIVLSILLIWLARRPLFHYLEKISPALLTAFSTSSSSATLPVTMRSVQDAGVEEKSVRFVLPLGATINMDGTALYEAVAVMFIAQAYGLDLSMGQQVIVLITATLAAIGAAGIPEAGLVTMVMVLGAVGLPTEGIALILSIDWFLDRCRTTVNVFGDSVGAAVINRLT